MLKKYCLSTMVFLFVLFQINAQCIPDTTLTEPGIYPVLLEEGCVDIAYSQTINFVFPVDTVIILPFPPIPVTVTFDSFVLESVMNIPTGLDYLCDNPTCSFVPSGPGENARGCVEIFGTPTMAYDDSVTITATVYATAPIIGQQVETLIQKVAMKMNEGGMVQIVLNTTDADTNSLRYWVNRSCLNDTITFDNSLVGDTINITSGELFIENPIAIQGPSNGMIAISGQSMNRIFNISNMADVFIKNLQLQNGSPTEGIILNEGLLKVEDVFVKK